MDLGIEWVRAWIVRSAELMTEHRSDLIALDRAIGDGDHGDNMHRGFRAAREGLAGLATDSAPAEALRLVAMTLVSTVGGAAGPLYGTAFLRAATSLGDARRIDGAQVATLLEAARDGIVERGGAAPGDKTMVDAWTPAAESARTAVAGGADAGTALRTAADAAARGARATEPLVARKGRASYLGERAVGHRDPGAESTAMLLAAAAEAAGA